LARPTTGAFRASIACGGASLLSCTPFDLIEIDGVDIRKEPIEARKSALATLLRGAIGVGIMFCGHIEGDAREIFEHACKLGYEGIVSKRAGSLYRSGRGKPS